MRQRRIYRHPQQRDHVRGPRQERPRLRLQEQRLLLAVARLRRAVCSRGHASPSPGGLVLPHEPRLLDRNRGRHTQ